MEGLTKDHGRGPHADASQWKGGLETTNDEEPISTEALVEHINGQNFGYTEGTQIEASSPSSLPRSFDAFSEWPTCHDVIRRDHDQAIEQQPPDGTSEAVLAMAGVVLRAMFQRCLSLSGSEQEVADIRFFEPSVSVKFDDAFEEGDQPRIFVHDGAEEGISTPGARASKRRTAEKHILAQLAEAAAALQKFAGVPTSGASEPLSSSGSKRPPRKNMMWKGLPVVSRPRSLLAYADETRGKFTQEMAIQTLSE
ncbi:unnamed protein product, partial [Prorocentrum cordatum]